MRDLMFWPVEIPRVAIPCSAASADAIAERCIDPRESVVTTGTPQWLAVSAVIRRVFGGFSVCGSSN